MEVIRRNTDYGIRALVHLASRPDKMASAAEIAESQGIPIDFLQKILQRLVRRGIVESRRGSQGGFSLARDPRRVTVLEMVETMQGKLSMNKCFLGDDGCPRSPNCPLKQNWLTVEEKIAEFLRGITLQDLVDQLRGTDS